MSATSKNKQRWIPEGYKLIRRNKRYGIEVYGKGLSAIAYSGKAKKADFFYRFPRKDAMKEYLDDYMKAKVVAIKAEEERMAQRNKPNSLKEGDILSYSWGYDQTNVDFYQVVATTKKSVKLRPIQQNTKETGFMAGHTEPVKDAFVGERVLTKRVTFGDTVSMDYGVGRKWDGRPVSCSWYA